VPLHDETLGVKSKSEVLMSTTMNWVGHAGGGPELYQELMVPAFFGPFAEDLVTTIGLQPGMSVLDVACGTGAVTRSLARALGPQGSVTGVDLSPGMLEVARSRDLPDGCAPIEYLVASAEDLPVEDGSFDVVTCQQGLQFFPDRLAALRAMRAALAPGGWIVISSWGEPGLPWLALAAALGRHIGADAGAKMLSPFALADPEELRALLVQAGFSGVTVRSRTLNARFRPREVFAQRLVLATPVAEDFLAASPEQQQRVIADVTDAVRDCDGGEHELVHPKTTNLAFARSVLVG
jgi:ubiquinone/menaquinone biosynthesis C-methylase UbiE